MASDNLISDCWYKDFNELISNLKDGDLVEICSGWSNLNRKWAVNVGDGKVIHYTGSASSSISASSPSSNCYAYARDDYIAVLANGKKARKNNGSDASSNVNDPSTIVKRALSKVQIQLPKEMFEGNHNFALWCRNGTREAKVTDWCFKDDLFPQLEVGDLIEIKSSRLFKHWAVYIGDKWCVHLVGEAHDMSNAWVRKDRYALVISKRECRINNAMDTTKQPFTESEIKERALSELDRVGYDWKSMNCEHFATGCRYDIGESLQVPKLFRGTTFEGCQYVVEKNNQTENEQEEKGFDLEIKD